MNRKQALTIFVFASALTFVACNSNEKKDKGSDTTTSEKSGEAANPKGVGKFKDIELTHPLDEKMVAAGQSIYNVKCESCHKLTDEKKVGPGWKGVTDRRTPEWIMNFVTNVDEMIEKDPDAQKMLEECLVRMPNQGLSDDDARHVLEFMRKNDGKN
jgi:hypothetical protein